MPFIENVKWFDIGIVSNIYYISNKVLLLAGTGFNIQW